MKTINIELAVADYFGYRKNIAVPNVSWGMGFNHELDVLIVSMDGYCTEIEIKISVSDLKADFKKKHGHKDDRIRRLFYAVPEKMKDITLKLVPEHAGVLICKEGAFRDFVECIRGCGINKTAKKLTEKEMINIGRLGCMRIWNLKSQIIKSNKK